MGLYNSGSALDLAVANRTSNNVSILIGNGNGTFVTPAPTYSSGGTGLRDVGKADFDSDGNLDLVVTNQDTGMTSVSVLTGNGDGTFDTAQSFTVGTRPWGMVVDDFNLDGGPDIATANSYGNDVSILLNDACDCYIDGGCYSDGDPNPSNSCQDCYVAAATDRWTNHPDDTGCDDFASATGGQCSATHGDPTLEWLGGSWDVETSAADDNDSDGIAAIYLVEGTCAGGYTYSYGCLVGNEIGAIEADICVADKASGRYASDSIYFSAFIDYEGDGTFSTVTIVDARRLDEGTNNPSGSCITVNDTAFEIDSTEMGNWAWGASNNCQRYRLTFDTADNVVIDHSNLWARFRVTYSTAAATSCSTETYGEVEDVTGTDYTVFGSNGEDCTLTETYAEFASFAAEATQDTIELSWETQVEPHALGYNVYRAGGEDRFVKLNSNPIPNEGDELMGASYGFIDYDVNPGDTFEYYVETVGDDGGSTFHGPVSATVPEPQFGCGVTTGSQGAGTLFVLLIAAAVLIRTRRR